MKRKRLAVLVLAALMAATTIFPASAYAGSLDTIEDGTGLDETTIVVL